MWMLVPSEKIIAPPDIPMIELLQSFPFCNINRSDPFGGLEFCFPNPRRIDHVACGGSSGRRHSRGPAITVVSPSVSVVLDSISRG